MIYKTLDVVKVTIKLHFVYEYEKYKKFSKFLDEESIYPAVSGGGGGWWHNSKYYLKEDAEKIKNWLKENNGKYNHFLRQ